MRRVLVVLLLLSATASVPSARQRGAAAGDTPATLVEVSWLVGHWVGTTAKGQHIEEMWMPAHDGHMAGVFRWERGNGRWLFELLTLDERAAAAGTAADNAAPAAPATPLTMRIKHFDRQLRGMEEKSESTTLRLVEHASDRVMFEMKDGARIVRVGYTRSGPDTLQATFDEMEPGKPAVHIDFPYRRVRSDK